MRGGTLWVGATLLLAGLALAAATAALAQAPGASSSSSSSSGGAAASASASAGAGAAASSSSSSSAAGGGGGQQQQQQQQQGGGGVVIVVAPPVAVPAVAINGTAGTAGNGNAAVPTTQVFTPPQEIILSSQPAQVFTPPAATPTQVVQTRPVGTFTPPARSGNLPFTGANTALGLIAGFALICSGALLLVRRRNDALALAVAEQESALRALARR